MDLTFAEQVKIVLSRKNMTIKQLAEEIQEKTGHKMSRQNLTQRLGRDNFQEQDMRMIAEILGCPFQLNILDAVEEEEEQISVRPVKRKTRKKTKQPAVQEQAAEEQVTEENDVTVGDMLDMIESISEVQTEPEAISEPQPEPEAISAPQPEPEAGSESKPEVEPESVEVSAPKPAPKVQPEPEPRKVADRSGIWNRREEVMRKKKQNHPHAEWIGATPQSLSKDFMKDAAETGEINPYTGKEYETNSVRMHPKRIGYIQVYDRGNHKWTDMTEWAFLGFQEQKKNVLGSDYDEPVYLD